MWLSTFHRMKRRARFAGLLSQTELTPTNRDHLIGVPTLVVQPIHVTTTIAMAGESSRRAMKRWKAVRLLLMLSAGVLALSLGRLMYHYVLFQGTIRTLTEF